MNIFIPISSTHTDQTGALCALGSSRIPDIAGSAPEVLEPLWEMSASRFAGEAEIELKGGVAVVRARISEGVAAEKTTRRVYRGFSLAVLAGGDGSLRIARCALCDAPDAVEKGIGAQFLKISRKQISMAKSVLIHDDQVRLMCREAKDRKSEAARITKANNPPPGGWPKPAGMDQHQGTGITGGGKGRDRAAYSEGTGADSCMSSIRAALNSPFKEAGGLITLLGGRRA
jgi:hypothetical protein